MSPLFVLLATLLLIIKFPCHQCNQLFKERPESEFSNPDATYWERHKLEEFVNCVNFLDTIHEIYQNAAEEYSLKLESLGGGSNDNATVDFEPPSPPISFEDNDYSVVERKKVTETQHGNSNRSDVKEKFHKLLADIRNIIIKFLECVTAILDAIKTSVNLLLGYVASVET